MLQKNILWQCMLSVFLLTGCKKNLTKDFPDADSPGLTVFSDKSNNILSCYVNGNAWRTSDRIFYSGGIGSSGTYYELNIYKSGHGILHDTLSFEWEGHFLDNKIQGRYLKLILSVKKDFDKNDFSALAGQRIVIDSTSTGYFLSDANGTSILWKGNGNIYFHKAAFDSFGYISALFDATINGLQITKGRLDEALTTQNMHLE